MELVLFERGQQRHLGVRKKRTLYLHASISKSQISIKLAKPVASVAYNKILVESSPNWAEKSHINCHDILDIMAAYK